MQKNASRVVSDIFADFGADVQALVPASASAPHAADAEQPAIPAGSKHRDVCLVYFEGVPDAPPYIMMVPSATQTSPPIQGERVVVRVPAEEFRHHFGLDVDQPVSCSGADLHVLAADADTFHSLTGEWPFDGMSSSVFEFSTPAATGFGDRIFIDGALE